MALQINEQSRLLHNCDSVKAVLREDIQERKDDVKSLKIQVLDMHKAQSDAEKVHDNDKIEIRIWRRRTFLSSGIGLLGIIYEGILLIKK